MNMKLRARLSRRLWLIDEDLGDAQWQATIASGWANQLQQIHAAHKAKYGER
jgi:hypothetical protein